MNSELLPRTKDGSVKISVRLTRHQLAELDGFCARMKLTRSQVFRRALKEHLTRRVIGWDVQHMVVAQNKRLVDEAHNWTN
jgi:metal-responsive CopG/Arc/MetJ family transcriptional regulator